MARRLASIAALLVGATLVVSPVWLFPHAGENCYVEVDRIEATDLPDGADVLRYRDLSPDAKRAFDRARADADGRAAVYGDRCPERFSFDWPRSASVVERGGTYYRLTTSGPGLSGFPYEFMLTLAFAVVGIAVATIGGVSLGTSSWHTPVAFTLLALGLLVAAATTVYLAPVPNPSLVGLADLTAVVVVATYVGVGLRLATPRALVVGSGAATLVAVALVTADVWTSTVAVPALVPVVSALFGAIVRRQIRRKSHVDSTP